MLPTDLLLSIKVGESTLEGEGEEGRSLGHDHDERRRKFKQKLWRLSTKRNLKMSRETNLQNRSWNACHSVNDGLIGLSDGVLLPVNNRLHCTSYSLECWKSSVSLPEAVTLIPKNRVLSDVTGCRPLNIYRRCEGLYFFLFNHKHPRKFNFGVVFHIR